MPSIRFIVVAIVNALPQGNVIIIAIPNLISRIKYLSPNLPVRIAAKRFLSTTATTNVPFIAQVCAVPLIRKSVPLKNVTEYAAILGVSGGMSLSGLIRRERRDLD